MDNFTVIGTVHECKKKITLRYLCDYTASTTYDYITTLPSPVDPGECCTRNDDSKLTGLATLSFRRLHIIITNVPSSTIIYRRLYTVTSRSGTGNKVHTHSHNIFICYILYYTYYTRTTCTHIVVTLIYA